MFSDPHKTHKYSSVSRS